MGNDTQFSRRNLLSNSVVAAVLSALPVTTMAQAFDDGSPAKPAKITLDDIKSAEKIAGITLTEEQRKTILASVIDNRESLSQLRELNIGNEVGLPTHFVPQGKQPKAGTKIRIRTTKIKNLERPKNDDDLPFMTVAELGQLLRERKVTSLELTDICIARLRKYTPKLKCVITHMDAHARKAAKRADEEIGQNKWRGPLHGIPCGVKDLFATDGYVTTWGAEPYREQMIREDSALIEKLYEAGAIVCAKLSMGGLAINDVWFGGMTVNPWNPQQGSSGSSAGSACSVSAGLLPFAIGTETLGSIISPSQRCRVTGLRPTFGRVSRYGAMALSWSMDKIGPIAKTAEDCALILSEICGSDPRDPSCVDRPLEYNSRLDLSELKIGILDAKSLDDDDLATSLKPIVKLLKKQGAKLKTIKFTPPIDGITNIIDVEGAAAFDKLTRSGEIDTLRGKLWPPAFRAGMFVSGVDFVQAMRARSQMMERFEEEFGKFDLVIANDRAGATLITTNFTGHPQLYIPLGVDKQKRPIGMSLIGRLYDEGMLCAVAHAIQSEVKAHLLRPDLKPFE